MESQDVISGENGQEEQKTEAELALSSESGGTDKTDNAVVVHDGNTMSDTNSPEQTLVKLCTILQSAIDSATEALDGYRIKHEHVIETSDKLSQQIVENAQSTLESAETISECDKTIPDDTDSQNSSTYVTSNLIRKSGRSRSSPESPAVKTPYCFKCTGSHYINNCKEFTDLSAKDRLKLTRTFNLCFNCYGIRHNAKNCRKHSFCKQGCKRKHSDLLHEALVKQNSTQASVEKPNEAPVMHKSTQTSVEQPDRSQLRP